MSRRFDISSIKNTYSPEEREEEESKTSHWGGEVYGEKVGSLDEAAVKRADGILEAARSYLVKRFGDPDLDAESVPDIEVMLAQLTREKGGAEKFSAHQRAQYYLGIKYLEAQIMDPKSDMAEQENLYDGDVLTRKGERLLEEIGKSREEIFFNLTGFKESRKRDTLWGKVKRLDGWLREKSLEAYREVKAKGKKARWQAKAWNFVGGMARRPLNNAVALGALGLTAGVMGGLDMGAMGRLAGEAGVGVAGLVGAQKVGRSEKPGESVLNTLVRRVAGKRILGHEIGGKEGTMSDERF
ncbi:hypothetical protein B5M47_03630 [candidate division CPR3 bacterium 4484_211]|uniref:Uncharacterized protein n=1 Tax=candidate division CPR3 bacterium 4484_211 TaxID=1968527 RepID=A0A1W9NX66_UNCC3|nr:MAG: hypothetical protein B5M47_03630 [candidate division CPR3 bacterium 4484_211]